MIFLILNFPNLKLVGVIMADTGLHMPDFRAAERTFSLITQVAGRAGRFFPDGKVIVQSYSPKQNAIYYACHNKTEEFYTDEIQTRQILSFPPYSRLIRFVFRSAVQQEAEKVCFDAADFLNAYIKERAITCNEAIEVLGPSECPLAKISANFRYQIILKCKNITEIQRAANTLLQSYTGKKNVYIEVDVDPLNLL